MKKVLTAIITIIVIILILSIPVSAQGEGTLSMEEGVMGQQGDTVDVSVFLDNNPGLISMKFTISYDSDLELQSVSNSNLLGGWTTPSSSISSPYIIRWADSLAPTNSTATGQILTLHFKIKDTATVGNHTVTLEFTESRDFDGGKNTFNNTSAVINVVCKTHTFDIPCRDNDNHWSKCSVCGALDTESIKPHEFNNACDTDCNVCDYVREITHSYTTVKTSTTEHWRICSVCENEESGSRDNHSGGNATCTDKAVCTYCFVAYGDKNANNHSKSTYHYTTNSNGTHKKLYDCCNATAIASEACSGGSATCQAKAVCQYCNTAYGDVGTVHNYNLTAWGYKATDGHAHVCKISGCNAHDTVVAHTSSGAPTEANAEICTICKYEINPALAHTTHIPKAEWSSDATHHWHECTGCSGQQLEKAEHIYDKACDTDCNTCGYVRTAEHSYTELKHNDTEHWYECACGAEKADSRVAHSGGTATCTAKAKCSVCNTEYGEVASHSYSTEWSKNDTEHWYECSCGAEKADSRVAHSGGTATCTAKAKCSVCNTEYGEAAPHSYSTEWSKNDTEHWYECACGAEKADSRVAHSGGTATCTAKAKCSVCNTEYGELASHSYSTEWSKNDTEHWHECACGEKSDKAEHAYGDDNVCDACGFEKESQGGTEPPSTDATPAPVDPGTNSDDDNGGTIAIIIAACVVAFGGGFALYWFVFKK